MIVAEGYAEVDALDAFLDDLAAIAEAHGCVVQAFDAGLVADEAHLERAVECADRAIERGEAIARDPAVEVLCYAAGRRQIEDALAMGVEEGRSPVAVVVADVGSGGESDDRADGSDDGGDADLEAAAAEVRELIEPAELERGTELGDPDRLAAYFDVTDAERAATDADLATLVRERVALLPVER